MSSGDGLVGEGAEQAVARGYAALAEWDWPAAFELFGKALAVEEMPEALEGLGAAASWLDDARVAMDARERAYRAYRDRGDLEGAARAAAGLADNLLTFRGDWAVASGWLGRARRALESCPESMLGSWVDVLEAYLAMAYERDVSRAFGLAEHAVELSRRRGDLGTEMVALALKGLIVASQGRFSEGMRLLDEATAAGVAGDIEDREAAANVCCTMVTAAVRTRDFDRLSQWSRAAMDVARGWPNRATFSYPRIEHAVALTWWGRWEEAERDLLGVIDDMESRPLVAALAMLRLADLRRRQGRLDEATALLDQLDDQPGRVGMGHLTGAIRAAVMLDRGEVRAAIAVTDRYLRAVPLDDLVERADGLEVAAIANAKAGELDRAAEAAGELVRIAQQVPTTAMQAAARRVSGLVAAAGGEHDAACADLGEAVRLCSSSGAVFDAARGRFELARSLLAHGHTGDAQDQMQAAEAAFTALGSDRWARAASQWLADTGSPTRRREPGHPLTPRELEVLRLVARGGSNDEISAALVLSPRTVERHLSNIYTKIGASGRTARAVATAYAHSHGLT